MPKLEEAIRVYRELEAELAPVCERISVAGSVRRRRPEVKDVEILVIPKDSPIDLLTAKLYDMVAAGILRLRKDRRGRTSFGPQNKLLVHVASGIGVDIFTTDAARWAVALVVRTGSKETNISIARAAKDRGMRFLAYGDGFDTDGGHIVCYSEEQVFRAVGLPYRQPWER
ncbi:MAG: hypothetical protein SVP26_02760 [Chloroflexota bacterium]|nr:hypothetical protein [Chloroflexota bacterium]